MQRWKIVFLINNVHGEEIVSANGAYAARMMVESKYKGQKFVLLNVLAV